MIRYPISEDELWNRIRALQPNWERRSQSKTAHFVEVGRYDESSSIWSEIKSIYMELQHSKCGYCERKLASADYGSIEHDLEHYRPKSRVRAYPVTSDDPNPRDARAQITYDFSTGDAWATGYYRLAYHPLNYLTACKVCNSILKSDYFPIAAARIDGASRPSELADEHPFLIYPIGDLDAAPESLIEFEGIIAKPIGKTPEERRRAQVTIDFFQLNDRGDLQRERSEVIYGLSLALTGLQSSIDETWKSEVLQLISRQMSSGARHANCSRCFVRLFQSNSSHAVRLAREASQLIR